MGKVRDAGRGRLFQSQPELAPAVSRGEPPTVFHITHPKAGSQWIHRILRECMGPRVVVPEEFGEQFLERPLLPHQVYPTLYLTKQQFDSVPLPTDWRRFVVIRDLRDTLVSVYFSLKVSHVVISDTIQGWRERLPHVSQEEGLLLILEEWLHFAAAIQWSWWEADEPLIRYEDLLNNDLEILRRVLLKECELGVPRQRFEEVIYACRFEQVTGRRLGQEDRSAHERKGVAGDWRNHFTPRVVRAFKDRFGGLLMDLGYERDLDW